MRTKNKKKKIRNNNNNALYLRIVYVWQELVVTSNSETDAAKEVLRRSGYTVATASGAGYKMLCVALGVVKCYALTKDSTYAWDTCAAHAMLASQGGTACHCHTADGPLTYRPKTAGGGRAHCNAAGVIASRDPQTVDRVYALLSPLHLDCSSSWCAFAAAVAPRLQSMRPARTLSY